MELSDNALMDLLLARKEPDGEVDLPHVHALLARLRAALVRRRPGFCFSF